jgi:hypothetical protein
MPVGSYDQQSNRYNIREWKEVDALYFGEQSQLKQYLKTIYKMRSAFVHGGDEWPFVAKTKYWN